MFLKYIKTRLKIGPTAGFQFNLNPTREYSLKTKEVTTKIKQNL